MKFEAIVKALPCQRLDPFDMFGRDVRAKLDAHPPTARQVEIPHILRIDRDSRRRQRRHAALLQHLGRILRALGSFRLLHFLGASTTAALGKGDAGRSESETDRYRLERRIEPHEALLSLDVLPGGAARRHRGPDNALFAIGN